MWLDPKHHPAGFDAVVGRYCAEDNPDERLAPWPDACPYCRGALFAFVSERDVVRVAGVDRVLPDGRGVALVSVIPPSHVVVSCRDCRADFVAPRHWPNEGGAT